MWKSIATLALVSWSAFTQASERDWQRTFDTMWETRWHQSGVPIGSARWPNSDKTIRFNINSGASSSNANRAREAMNTVAKVLDWKALEVPSGDATAQIEFNIRTYSNEELSQATCHASPQMANWLFSKQRLSISEQWGYKCILHELMHAFGFPGHPQGDTVLSYFQGNQNSLLPLDQFLLKAWYSDAIKPGESPFVTIRTLNRLWITQHVSEVERDKATAFEQVWFSRMVQGMESYALAKGEPPTILYRSGRISEEGIRQGRLNIQGMLGFLYVNGLTVDKDLPKAARLLLAAAQGGNGSVSNILATQLTTGSWPSEQAAPLCEFFHKTPAQTSRVNSVNLKAALESETCKAVITQ